MRGGSKLRKKWKSIANGLNGRSIIAQPHLKTDLSADRRGHHMSRKGQGRETQNQGGKILPREPGGQYLISDLAEEFGITTRSIRYYEKQGLISPSRTNGNYRIFSGKDRTRLRLILRGKRFGYSLEQIREMIGYWNSEPEEIDQIKRSLTYGDKKLLEIRSNIEELKRLEDDLLAVKDRLLRRLENIEGS